MLTLVVQLLQPLTLTLLLGWLFTGLAWRRRWATRKTLLAAATFQAVIWCLASPIAGHYAIRLLDRDYPPLRAGDADFDAIVVLAGGVSLRQHGDELLMVPSHESITRCLEAARVFHEFQPIPLLVSGGKVDPARPGAAEAECLGKFLAQLGVPEANLMLETRSRNTYENAVYSSEILRQRGLDSALLVTTAVHMPRAEACFLAQGLRVTTSGCGGTSVRYRLSMESIFPCSSGLQDMEYAAHESIGYLWYWLNGRFSASE